MQEERIKYLFQLHLSKACTPAEREELAALALEEQHVPLIKELISNAWNTTGEEHDLSTEKTNELFTRIIAQKEEAAGPESLVVSIKPRIQLWKRIAIAASVIFIIGIGIYILSLSKGDNDRHPENPELVEGSAPSDVPAPDRNRAQIKLSDGTIVYLDSAANGELVNTNGVVVTKTEDGKIVYSSLTTHDSPLTTSYNTLMNPRGSKVQPLTLSDGTKLWLNAASSVTYPTAFTGNERRVEITGEAYFEVAPNKSKPFIVSANNKADVTVLGTHFNVNAYEDESEIKVTLMEGSVKVSNDVDAKTIKPNQQATVKPHSPLTIHHSPDLEQILAWKNGLFEFNNTELPVIMRQLARWYDLDIIYQSQPSHEKYGGGISNNMPLSNVLKLLEANGVKFQLQGRKLIVKP